MTPTKRKASASEWRPTELQLAVLRELHFAAGARPWLEVARAVSARVSRPSASATLKSLVARGAVVSDWETVMLTEPGRSYVSAVCIRKGRHTPTEGAPERCAECGARLVADRDARRLHEAVRGLLGDAAGLAANVEAQALQARRLERQGDYALLRRSGSLVGEARAGLEVLLELAGRDADARQTSIALAVAVSGPGTVSHVIESDVARLVDLGWAVVDGPSPWRARRESDGREVTADSVGSLYGRVVDVGGEVAS